MGKIENIINNKNEEFYMNLALKEARKATVKGDVPIGCVIVYEPENLGKRIEKTVSKRMCDFSIKEGDVIAKAYNQRNAKCSAIAHAEVLAIHKACKKIQDFRLDECTMYVTLEPCQMCAGAIVQSRIKKLVIAADSIKSGACGTIINILQNNEFNHKVIVKRGVMAKESEKMIKVFFEERRKKG